MSAYSEEDVGNIVALEHVNVQVPDQSTALLFYVVGLGLTRDPYLTVGLNNMWVNVGEQQFHLPTRPAQVVPGAIALVMPSLDVLKGNLAGVEKGLAGTKFKWSEQDGYVAVTCPWGNHFRCYQASSDFGDMALGMPYVEFYVPPGSAKKIVGFYDKVLAAPGDVIQEKGASLGRVRIGRSQLLLFRETAEPQSPYDGHHVAIYVANFSEPYGILKERGLISEDVRNHQFRFQKIVDLESGEPAFMLEHEVRSMHHPMFHRPFVNRDPVQSQRAYRRGRDAVVPFSSGQTRATAQR
jgi:hypothetical protein